MHLYSALCHFIDLVSYPFTCNFFHLLSIRVMKAGIFHGKREVGSSLKKAFSITAASVAHFLPLKLVSIKLGIQFFTVLLKIKENSEFTT